MANTNELVNRVMRAKEENRLHDGVLLQVRTDASVQAPWFVAAEARQDILDIFRTGEADAQITSDVLGRDDRIAFWAIGYQVHSVQYRFLLPLVGPTVAEMIEQLRITGFGVLMHGRRKESAVQAHFTVSPGIYETLKERHQISPDLSEAMSEHGRTIAQMLDPEFLSAIPELPRVDLVSVGSVLPQEMDALLDREAERSRKP